MDSKFLTINTDASFSQKHKVGTYAFYAVCDKFKIQKSGKLKENMKGSTYAEVMAIGNAISYILDYTDQVKIGRIIINTDCMHAVTTIKKAAGTKGLENEVFRLWQKLIQRCESKDNEFRHVPAHSGTATARKWVNDWCDKAAKSEMNELLKEIEK